jgi:tartrate-resistant acid phosphatase type 5
MPEFHAEPYIYLPAISHKSALVAWGAFYFRVSSSGGMKLVDPDDLEHVHPPRTDTIGARSAPYGPARVEVRDGAANTVAVAMTDTANHCWVTGLKPDTEYAYTVFVKGEQWAEGERWNWSPPKKALVQGGRYDNRFRTNPDPASPAAALTFAVIGDFGIGMKKESKDRRQQQVGDALRAALGAHDIRFMLTTGDNIYAGKRFLGLASGDTGNEDDDWFFTYFQPYRYVINRICVFPSIGNHDTGESEDTDDRAQVEDNFYVRERLTGEEAAGRASSDPGMFYRFRYGSDIEFVCIDTSKEHVFAKRLFEHPKHQPFLDASFPVDPAGPRWRIPFCHHPPFSAGPRHHNTESMHRLLPLFHRAGVKAMFSGHEHNFQHSVVDGINYFVSGAAGKLREEMPNQFAEAHTRSWSSRCHFLLVEIAGDRMVVRAIGELDDEAGLTDIPRLGSAGGHVTEPMVIRV